MNACEREPKCPIRRVPRSPAAASRAAFAARSTWERSGSTSPKNTRPAVVRRTRVVLRSKSVTPSACSRSRTCSLSVGALTWRRSAARRKLSSPATAAKYLRCRSSMGATVRWNLTVRMEQSHSAGRAFSLEWACPADVRAHTMNTFPFVLSAMVLLTALDTREPRRP